MGADSVKMKIVYRYDNNDYEDGEIIHPSGDTFDILTEVEKVVEVAIRKTLPDGVSIRGASIYTLEDETVAKRLWKLSHRNYLYELEIDEDSIRHIGDLNLYSEAKDAVQGGRSPDKAIESYCKGELAGPHFGQPRREILAREARVVRKVESLPSMRLPHRAP